MQKLRQHQPRKEGVVGQKLARDKVVQYMSKYLDFNEHEIVPACAEVEEA